MAAREKQTLTGDRVITGRLTVYGGVNSPDVVKNITDLATTKEQVNQLETTVDEIADEPFGPAIRSSSPAIVIKSDGTVVPEEITFQGIVKPLNGDPSFYLGIFKIYKDGSLYYTTPTAVTSLTWTVDIVQSLTPGPEVYPSINLYPSFSNRLITIELYDDTGTDLKDTLNISILPSWESYIQNELTDYTPKYIGKFNGAHASSYHNGDWWLVYDTDDTPITRGVYRAINYTPTLVDGSDAANSQFIVAALPDILWASNNSYGDLDDYAPITYISNLVANAAFISNLFAQYIKIQTGGSIRGGDRYDEDGAVIDGTKPGFFIGASGACKVAGIEFDGFGGAEWSGGNQLATLAASGMTSKPALCVLGVDKIVVADQGLDKIRIYNWNGNTIAYSGVQWPSTTATWGDPYLAALSNTDFAFIEPLGKSLARLTYNGSAISVLGSLLTISNSGNIGLCAMNETDVALYEGETPFGTNGKLYLVRWDQNTNTWSKIGSGTSFQYYHPELTSIGPNRIMMSDPYDDEIIMVDWDEATSSWSQVGSTFDIAMSQASFAPLNMTDIIMLDIIDDRFKQLKWNGSGFSIIDELSTYSDVSSGNVAIKPMNGTDIAFVDTTLDVVRVYRFNFSLTKPWRYPFDS